jgi:hyaluronan synthase
MVVGWKEDHQYFKMCLESIRTTLCNVLNVRKVLVIIDGDEPDDNYMIDIFHEIFAETSSIKSCHIHFDTSLSFQTVVNLPQYQSSNAICITQKHEGKRNCMYTGFKLSLLDPVETVFSTDSDTVLSPDCLPLMFNVLLNDSSHSISGICGNLGIYNRYSSIISFLASLRYFYAFNIERAYQSFNGYLMCISGPIGLYRLDYVSKILDTWKNQTFLGNPCTYGDDRHLTNQLLSLNSRLVYTPLSSAETETPSSIYRFFKQQTRWNKSSIRELFWTIPLVDNYSLFLTIDLVYTMLFPFVVIGWLFYLLFAGTLFQLGLYSCMFIGIGILKSIYAACVYHRYECLFYFLYAYVYVCITFPSRLWALLNISDTNWGTTMRIFHNQPYTLDFLAPVFWNCVLLSGLAYTFYRDYHAPLFHYLLFFLPHTLSAIGFSIMYAYINTRIGFR